MGRPYRDVIPRVEWAVTGDQSENGRTCLVTVHRCTVTGQGTRDTRLRRAVAAVRRICDRFIGPAGPQRDHSMRCVAKDNLRLRIFDETARRGTSSISHGIVTEPSSRRAAQYPFSTRTPVHEREPNGPRMASWTRAADTAYSLSTAASKRSLTLQAALPGRLQCRSARRTSRPQQPARRGNITTLSRARPTERDREVVCRTGGLSRRLHRLCPLSSGPLRGTCRGPMRGTRSCTVASQLALSLQPVVHVAAVLTIT
jgi:hypothetical protein